MRHFLYIIIILISFLFSQDIVNKLGGTTENETYDVTNSNDELLFRVQGDGQTLINNHLYVGTEDGTNDDYIYIDDGTEYLRWLESGNAFVFSNDIAIGTDDWNNDDVIYFDSGNDFLKWDESETGFQLSSNLEIINNDDAVLKIDAGVSDNPRIRFVKNSVEKWDIETSSTTEDRFYIYNEGRTKYVRLNQTCDQWIFGSTSDKRLKQNITPKVYVLDDLLKLNAITFNYTTSQETEIGLIAQEVKKYFPEVVSGVETDSTYLSIIYSHLSPLLLQGIKELKTEKDQEIQELKDRIEELEKLIKD